MYIDTKMHIDTKCCFHNQSETRNVLHVPCCQAYSESDSSDSCFGRRGLLLFLSSLSRSICCSSPLVRPRLHLMPAHLAPWRFLIHFLALAMLCFPRQQTQQNNLSGIFCRSGCVAAQKSHPKHFCTNFSESFFLFFITTIFYYFQQYQPSFNRLVVGRSDLRVKAMQCTF